MYFTSSGRHCHMIAHLADIVSALLIKRVDTNWTFTPTQQEMEGLLKEILNSSPTRDGMNQQFLEMRLFCF